MTNRNGRWRSVPSARHAAAERLALALADAAEAARDLAFADEQLAPIEVPEERPVLMSIAAAGTALGVSRSTVYTMVEDGRLPTRHVGRRRLVPTAAIDAFAQGSDRDGR